jgi:iron(II)-dependent oxidoreductase
MVWVPGGWFLMGSPEGEGDDDEHPQRWIYVDGFWMDVYEVTNAQYKAFCDAAGYPYPPEPDFVGMPRYFEGHRDYPVVNVSWEDVVAYAKWAGRDLPTKAEWEYAARGGREAERYPWGNAPPNGGGIYRANYDPGQYVEDGYRYTAPVGSFAPNGYGLYDMAGNVWEWCADWYAPGYQKEELMYNPTGPREGVFRVLRGGSWGYGPSVLRCAYMLYDVPTSRTSFVGFRCVRRIM